MRYYIIFHFIDSFPQHRLFAFDIVFSVAGPGASAGTGATVPPSSEMISKMGTWGPSSAKPPSRNTGAYVFTSANGWSKSTTNIDKESPITSSSTNTIVPEGGEIRSH